MKKLLTLLALLAALTFTLTACGGSDAPAEEETDVPAVEEVEPSVEEETDAATEEETDASEEEEPDAPAKEETDAPAVQKPDAPAEQKPAAPPAQTPETPEEKPEAPEAGGESLSKSLTNVFLANAGGSATGIAEAVMADLPFAGMVMPVEPGLLMGFGNTEITGFSQGVMFGPSISSIPFLGYVFQLDGSVDGSAFCQTLKSNADLRWNVCTAAEEMVAVQSGSYVFFLMCPTSLEG